MGRPEITDDHIKAKHSVELIPMLGVFKAKPAEFTVLEKVF